MTKTKTQERVVHRTDLSNHNTYKDKDRERQRQIQTQIQILIQTDRQTKTKTMTKENVGSALLYKEQGGQWS